ncbi:hypothetical protein Q3G72_025319 [Acer saccharum]|nr:hypothetical protein Q3G72_025319 [Acer saccharum]
MEMMDTKKGIRLGEGRSGFETMEPERVTDLVWNQKRYLAGGRSVSPSPASDGDEDPSEMEPRICSKWSRRESIHPMSDGAASPFAGVKWSIVLFGVVYKVVLSLPGFSEVVEILFRDLSNLKNLKYLSMDETNLNISFLQNIGLLTSLESLSLRSCNLEGTLPDQGPLHLPTHSHQNLTSLEFSNNFLHGNIPIQVGAYLPMLRNLNISINDFDGCIPSSIGDMKQLSFLDLSYNKLSSGILEHLAESCINLQYLVLSNNSLEGQIFSAAHFNLKYLMRLQLYGNQFIGKIPECLSNSSSYLKGLYLGDNHLSSRIPSWLGNMSQLVDLKMPNNHLECPIPLEFCQLQNLQVLNLAENNIYGDLPSCFSPPQIQQVHLSKNRLEGQLKDAFFNSSSLVTLDLGYNRFNGGIPNLIGRLSNLIYLILTHNNLEGEVPHLLCNLERLRLIDLSHNNFSGQIPHCLDMTALHGDFSTATEPMRNEEDVPFEPNNASYFFKTSFAPLRKEETVVHNEKDILLLPRKNSYLHVWS